MPMAPVPAARQALQEAGLRIYDITAVKTHNPFAVNDVYFAREFDLAFDAFNNHGSSLVYGHPQGPTGMRLVIELIEELVDRGGGYGLFTGCAAGDTGAAVVLKVGGARQRRERRATCLPRSRREGARRGCPPSRRGPGRPAPRGACRPA